MPEPCGGSIIPMASYMLRHTDDYYTDRCSPYTGTRLPVPNADGLVIR